MLSQNGEGRARAGWLLGWLGGSAGLHWGAGWSWWWALPVPLVPAYLAAGGVYMLCLVVCEVRRRRYAPPARAALVMDELATKLFCQLDDPMPGQRANALELLRTRLAKDGRTFRDLLHEFEG